VKALIRRATVTRARGYTERSGSLEIDHESKLACRHNLKIAGSVPLEISATQLPAW